MANFYKSTKWKNARETSLRLAGYVCQECKRHGITNPNDLHVHHVNPIEERPDLMLDQRNLYVCCAGCHNQFEDRNTNQLTKKGEELRARMNRRR